MNTALQDELKRSWSDFEELSISNPDDIFLEKLS